MRHVCIVALSSGMDVVASQCEFFDNQPRPWSALLGGAHASCPHHMICIAVPDLLQLPMLCAHPLCISAFANE